MFFIYIITLTFSKQIGNLTIEYSFTEENIQISLTCKTLFWCAIGFGDTYTNSDMIRISYESKKLYVLDMLEKPSTTFIEPLYDSSQDIYIIDSGITSDSIWATFLKPIISDDPTDAQLNYYDNTEMWYMINQDTLNYSDYTTYGKFTLQTWSCHNSCSACDGPFSYQCTACEDTQVINGYCDDNYYNNLTNLYNNQIIVEDEFIIYWEYNENFIIFQIEIFYCGWFGIGFNNNEMNTTDILYFTISTIELNDTTYSISVDDQYGSSQSAPYSDTQLYGTQDWKIDSFKKSGNNIYVRVHRKLTTDDEYDYDFSNMKDIEAIYAYGTSDSPYHYSNRGAFLLELSKNQISNDESEWENLVLEGHVIMMLLLWALVSDIGIFFGRQLKSYPKYVRVHGIIFLFLTLTTYLFVFSMISNQSSQIQQLPYQNTSFITHFLLGICLLFVMTIQSFMGLLARNNLESPHGTYLIYKVKILHKYNGYFIYCLTKIQVLIGLNQYNSSYNGLLIIYYIILLMTKFTIEMLYHFQVSAITRKRINNGYVEVDQQSLYQSLVEKLNTGSYYKDIIDDYPKLTYILLREAIYDVSDFNHPGGQYIFKKIKGKEIGRYFYGSYPIKDTQLHQHTQFAINYIETRYIGDFKNENCPLLHTLIDAKPSYIWKLIETKQIGLNIVLFRFSSDIFKVSESLNGVAWFGRYFYLKPFASGIEFQERPYTVVQCLSEANIKYRYELIEYFKSGQWNIKPPVPPVFSNHLQFVIKKYNATQNLSKFIHKSHHKRYEITGPYGFGLELDFTSHGVYYAFCQGTGILPFLDLCDYLLKKCLFQEIEKKSTHQSNFNQLDNFKFILCISCKDQCIGYPIIQDLEYLCKTLNLNYFEFHQTKLHYNQQYIQGILQYQVQKVYICGFQKFEDDITNLLCQCGIDKRKITQI